MKLKIFIIAMLVCAIGVGAQNLDHIKQLDEQQFKAEIYGLLAGIEGQQFMNEETPGMLRRLFGNERMNIHIDNGYIVIAGIATEDGTVTETAEGEISDATLDVFFSTDTVIKIAESEDPLNAAVQAIQDKEITYNAKSLGGKIKFGIVKFFLRFFG